MGMFQLVCFNVSLIHLRDFCLCLLDEELNFHLVLLQFIQGPEDVDFWVHLPFLTVKSERERI